MKKAKEDWIDTQYEETETSCTQSNIMKACQLANDLTLEKQAKFKTIQDKSGKTDDGLTVPKYPF